MSLKSDKDKSKQLQEKCQTVLNALLRDEDNKYCVDCDSKGPRWASWNLGVFLCIRCAGIHRNLGVHISKVKSVNLDSWTPEQVVSLQQMGNSRARAVYEANLPDNFRRPQNDSSLETFIRAKYEHKKYIAREWVPPALPEVNWEREIEEEMEKQKRKKKSMVEKRISNNVEVPQLPKPKNASPKLTRSAQVQPVIETKQNTDLLGLQNSDDGFSSFLSSPAPASVIKEPEIAEKIVENTVKSEEESFFNQIAPTEKEKAKLTKDSILALYGNTPQVNNFNQTYQNQMSMNQFQQNPYQMMQPGQNFGQFQAPNNFPPMQNPSFANPAVGNTYQMKTNQFASMPSQQQFASCPPGAVYPPMNQQMMNPNLNQFQGQVAAPQGQVAPHAGQMSNAYYSNQAALQQQFGNMTLNGQNGSSLAANTSWQ